ncbi:Retrovirus-related Pol polyprotein from transposon TNT 1-94 [Cucumis melo var. makuwa]|uniref:Retrovirus-related Pol polyprotein from transposon TNT 1-94 n=1 Tax=Cucumis melo var. makuwa TaxID=1194695 RepID=A0A5A7TXG6_CUCMM|nr:Retrovirus-related Pol polyprotein from transposon TNT 1-94 [Cucumis melo var. makuwa]
MVLLSNKTPFATLFEKEADYNIIKTFDCLAYAPTLPANRTKFGPRVQPCVFMGFPSSMKGYKLYDIAKKKFFVSRDILFFEELLPFHSIKEKGTFISHDFLEQFVIPCPLFDCLEKETIIDQTTKGVNGFGWVRFKDIFNPTHIFSSWVKRLTDEGGNGWCVRLDYSGSGAIVEGGVHRCGVQQRAMASRAATSYNESTVRLEMEA